MARHKFFETSMHGDGVEGDVEGGCGEGGRGDDRQGIELLLFIPYPLES